jgi:hypothetical protein
MQVENNLAQVEKQVEDQQINKFPNMRNSDLWSDAITNLDFIQDVLNPNAAHDLEIMRLYWE